MKRKSSITTRVGDRGNTFLFSGEEVPKNSDRTEAYGDLDELVSALGLARTQVAHVELKPLLIELQRVLFVIGSELATSREGIHRLKDRIDAARLRDFEALRDAWEARIEMPSGFVLPGECAGAAHLDLARAVARRVERRAVALQRQGLIDNPDLLVFLNRMSDLLWILARFEEGGATRLK